MRKLIIVSCAVVLSACSTVPERRHQEQKIVTSAITLTAIALVAGSVHRSVVAEKCDNNRAGFYQGTDNKIYTCPY